LLPLPLLPELLLGWNESQRIGFVCTIRIASRIQRRWTSSSPPTVGRISLISRLLKPRPRMQIGKGSFDRDRYHNLETSEVVPGRRLSMLRLKPKAVRNSRIRKQLITPSTPNDKTDDLQDRGTVDQNGEWTSCPNTIKTVPECC